MQSISYLNAVQPEANRFETTEYHIYQSMNCISAGWLALGNTNQLFLSFRMNDLEIWGYLFIFEKVMSMLIQYDNTIYATRIWS